MPENSQFYGISIAPDRSFKEREAYRLLKQEMNTRNEDFTEAFIWGGKVAFALGAMGRGAPKLNLQPHFLMF